MLSANSSAGHAGFSRESTEDFSPTFRQERSPSTFGGDMFENLDPRYAAMMRAPTYSVKVTVDLQPPMKASVVLNIVKDCTVMYVLRCVLKKYHHFTSPADSVATLCNNCALCAPQMDSVPNPLPLDKKDNLAERLMEFGIPYPFALTLTLRPDYIRRREEETDNQRKMAEFEVQRQIRVQEIAEELRLLVLDELFTREQLQRVFIAEVQRFAFFLLEGVEVEFHHLIELQSIRELQDAKDAKSDAIFFAQLNLRQRQYETKITKKRSHLIEQDAVQRELLLKIAFRAADSVAMIEQRIRNRIKLLSDCSSTRLRVKYFESSTRIIRYCEHDEFLGRCEWKKKEISGWTKFQIEEREERLTLTAAAFAALEDSKTERHNKRLVMILGNLESFMKTTAIPEENILEKQSYSAAIEDPAKNSSFKLDPVHLRKSYLVERRSHRPQNFFSKAIVHHSQNVRESHADYNNLKDSASSNYYSSSFPVFSAALNSTYSPRCLRSAGTLPSTTSLLSADNKSKLHRPHSHSIQNLLLPELPNMSLAASTAAMRLKASPSCAVVRRGLRARFYPKASQTTASEN